ncbi:MAG: sulfite exporter TauE/SafE family protein, partial [Actinomycetota bacterium]
ATLWLVELTATDLLLASLAVGVGALVQGSIGFGVNVVGGPILVLIDTRLVPGPALVAAFVLTLLVGVRDRAGIDRSGFGWVFLGRIPTSVAAALLVAALPERGLAISLAVAVLIAVAISALGWRVERTPPTLFAAGAISGVMGTVSAIGGPPVAMLYQDAKGAEVRGTLSAIFAVGALTSMVLLAGVGRFGLAEIYASLALMPAIVGGFWLSRFTTRWLDRGFVRPTILILCAASAIAAMVRYAL